MTIYKIFGSFLIFFSSAALSVSTQRRYNKSLAAGEWFLRLIRYIRTEITCFGKPLSKIFASFSEPMPGQTDLMPVLREQGLGAFLDLCRQKDLLFFDVFTLLSSLSGELGHGYREEQIAVLRRYEEELSALLAARQAERPKKEKVTAALFLFGSGAVILLLL